MGIVERLFADFIDRFFLKTPGQSPIEKQRNHEWKHLRWQDIVMYNPSEERSENESKENTESSDSEYGKCVGIGNKHLATTHTSKSKQVTID